MNYDCLFVCWQANNCFRKMSMVEKIKYWASTIKPHKRYMWGLFLSSISSSLLVLFQSLPKSKIVICLTSLDYGATTLWLIISLLLNFGYCVCIHLNYKCYYLLSKHCTIQTCMQIYDKIERAPQQNLAQKSIDKILITTSEHINSCIKFADDITVQCCHIISAIVAIGIVSLYNIYIGVIMFTISTLIIFLHILFGKKANIWATNINSSKEKVGTIMHNVLEKRDLIRSYNLQGETKRKYLDSVEHLISDYNFKGKIYSIKSYLTYGLLYIIITAISIWLAHLTHTNRLALSSYLIITPYLANIIKHICSSHDIFYKLEEIMIPTAKIQSLQALPDKGVSSLGTNSATILFGNLVFDNVSYAPSDATQGLSGVENINLCILPNSISLICGDHACGKKTLFNLLCRTYAPTSGAITMADINIYDFDTNAYARNFSYTSSSPTFYCESIIDNLKYSHQPKKEIYKLCKRLGIDEEILKLPHKYQTNLVKEKNICSEFLIFVLGLTRAILTASKWIAIYKLPSSLTDNQLNNIKNILLNFKSKHSFIIFDNTNSTKDICDQVWYMKDGKINNKDALDNE